MPDWLPDIFVVNPWSHDTYDSLYGIFCEDIRDASLSYDGHYVWTIRTCDDGREALFWHLTSRKQPTIPRRKRKFERKGTLRESSRERIPDLRRCERLPWINPLIHNATACDVLAWDHKEGNRDTKTYIWFQNGSFVVIMKRCKNRSRLLITSFYVDNTWKRKDLERKYSAREA